MNPLAVVANSHDIVLYGRVLDYDPAHLSSLLYTDHALFDYGGTVMIHPVEELPFWRVVMERRRHQPRHALFVKEHAKLVEMVYNAICERGPLSVRDFDKGEYIGTGLTKGTFRSGNSITRALYSLWNDGEIMTHSRRGLERVYDLRERISPARFAHAASAEEADGFFELKVLQEGGILSARSWKNWFSDTIGRPVSSQEASARLERLLKEGKIAPVVLRDDPKTQHFLLAEDLPLLEKLHVGALPEQWQPLDTSTQDEMVFLAPLEIVSARGRALLLFDFEYLWEVYKPQEKRRWGYYTLPILYQDTLVARTDLKLERETRNLVVKGFWLEKHIEPSEAFIAALARAFQRFMHFVKAEQLDGSTMSPALLREKVEQSFHTL